MNCFTPIHNVTAKPKFLYIAMSESQLVPQAAV